MTKTYRFIAKNPHGPGRATATAAGPFDRDFAFLKAMYEEKGWEVTLTTTPDPTSEPAPSHEEGGSE